MDDRACRKLVYLYGFAIFSAASAACAVAPSLGILIGLRVVQAAGAAMLQANSVALVVTSVPEARRRAALGIQAAAQAIGLASGPVLGGLLVSTAGWRWVFFLNVPVGLVAIAAGVYLLPRTRELASQGGTDLPGMTLLAATVTAGMLGLSAMSGLQWPAGAVAGCAAGLAAQPPQAVTMILLSLLGAGLGLYTPANNAEVMTVLPARDAATAGGMVNMTRGIGTALGVTIVTLGLHIARDAGHPAAGAALSMGLLAVAGLLATAAGTGAARPAATSGRPRRARPPNGGQ